MIVSQLGALSESDPRREGARGILIAIEGVDGTGKTTVAHGLQSALNKEYSSGVVHVSFPTQTCKDSYVCNLF